jgi:hypothetical protein
LPQNIAGMSLDSHGVGEQNGQSVQPVAAGDGLLQYQNRIIRVGGFGSLRRYLGSDEPLRSLLIERGQQFQSISL